MVRNLISRGLIASLMVASPVSLSAQAITERGPGKFELSRSGGTQNGFGAELRLSVPLGGDSTAKPGSTLPRVELNAGPSMLFSDNVNGRAGGQLMRAQGGLVSLRLTPGHSTRLSIAGQNISSTYGPLAADEEREEEKGGLGSDIAWVALVAGGVMVVLIGAVVLHCNAQEGGSCSE